MAGKPSEAAPEEPKQANPEAEEPKIDKKPIAEQPVAEQPQPEQPKTEQPVAEQPQPEQPKAEQPVAEQPQPEKPKAEQPDNHEKATPKPAQESPAEAPASQPAKKQQPEPPKKPKKAKSIQELRKEIKETTMKALDALFLSAPNACLKKQVYVWVDAGETDFVGFTGLEDEMKEYLATEKGYEFKNMELRQGRPENEKDAKKLNIEEFDVFLQILNFDDIIDEPKKLLAKKARIEVFGDRGDLEQQFYELSSEELQKANRSYYNIGRSEFPNMGSGSYRQNHIIISDTLRREINGHVSRAHAKIGFSNNIGFFLQPEFGGTPLAKNRTRIIREPMQEPKDLFNPNAIEPLQSGDLIELGKHVVLKFTEIDN